MEEVKYIPGDLVKINGVINVIDGIYSKSFSKDRVIEAHAIEGDNTNRYRYDLDFGKIVSIVPIPLTSDILENNGFEINLSDDIVWYRWFTGKSYLYIHKHVFIKNNWTVCVGLVKHYIADVRYLHQLQHFLFGLGLSSDLKV